MLTDQKDNVSREAEIRSTMSSCLLDQLKQGSDGAWEKVVALYYPMIYGWCRISGIKPQDSADICQDVLRSVLTSLKNFHRDKDGSTFRGWLRRITQRRIYDFRQHENRHPEAVGGSDAQKFLLSLEAVDLNSSHGEQLSETLRSLLKLIQDEFESQTWDAFWKSTVMGESAVDVAESLNTSRNAIYLAKSRVLRRLREKYNELFT